MGENRVIVNHWRLKGGEVHGAEWHVALFWEGYGGL